MQNFSKKNTILILVGVLVVVFVISLFFIFKQKTPRDGAKKVYHPIPKEAEFAKEQLIVQFFNIYTEGKNKKLDEKLKEIGVISVEKLYKDTNDPILERYYIVYFKKGIDVKQIHKTLFDFKEVENADPNFVMRALEVPNDQYYSQMWGLQKIGAEEAWNITKGSTDIIVAVTDTGIDYNHSDLPNENIIKGPDFINGDNDPMDDHMHGTHVAGTIGALTNNSTGVAGINWNVKLMAIKVLSSGGIGYDSQAAQGIQYAADNGAKVVNMSLGGNGYCSGTYQGAIDYAKSKGTLVVVAAGNDNRDASGSSPANCRGVLTVGSTTSTDAKSGFSNYGSVVSISAPGSGIISTVPGGRYQQLSGTSMATPHVAGAAGLLLSAKPDLTVDQARDCLIKNADDIPASSQIGPRLNIYKAINDCAGGDPPPTSDITPSGSVTATPSISPTATPIPVVSDFSIFGHVYNSKRAGIPGKTIIFHRTDSFPGLSGSEVSNHDGDYSLQDLEKGSYKLGLMLSDKIYLYPKNLAILNETTPNVQVDFIIGDDTDTPPDIDIIIPPSKKEIERKSTTQPQRTSNPTAIPKTTILIPSDKLRATPTGRYKCEPDPTCVKNSKGLKMCPLKCTPI